MNWIAFDLAGGGLSNEARASLANQAQWLSQNLETHLLGNHLFANLKALIFAGNYFQGPVPDGWLRLALGRLDRELDEQILADGGHFELSPMYHAIFVTDILDLINLSYVYPDRLPCRIIDRLRVAGGRAIGWLAAMTHPDGEISQFNDAALEVAPNLKQLKAYAAEIDVFECQVGARHAACSVEALHLGESGYVRLQSENAVVICDIARIGPDHLPGHAHADTLSYEMSINGARIVVNGGTSRYGSGSKRLRERSTLSHSTVEVADKSSSEVWSGFRVARRARPFAERLEVRNHDILLSASHDGYRRLSGAPVHSRTWTFGPNELIVEDAVCGGRHQAIARHVLYPDCAERLADTISFQTTPAYKLVRAFHAPKFGHSLATRAIAVPLVDGRAGICWSWR